MVRAKEVTEMRWYAQDEVNGKPGGEWTEWGWRSEEGSWFHRWGVAYLKERLVICNEEDTDGQAVLLSKTTINKLLQLVDRVCQRLWNKATKHCFQSERRRLAD